MGDKEGKGRSLVKVSEWETRPGVGLRKGRGEGAGPGSCRRGGKNSCGSRNLDILCRGATSWAVDVSDTQQRWAA